MSAAGETTSTPPRVAITPTPTDDEVAAIVAAIQVATPGGAAEDRRSAPRWRFSGRWWSKPAPMRRRRPWGV
ncbi:MAG: acyl-CoA carboxylase epsilon subunit [Microthrixaceae bacterium]